MDRRLRLSLLWLLVVAACSTQSKSSNDNFCGTVYPSCPNQTITTCGEAFAKDCSVLQPQLSDAYQQALLECARKFDPCSAAFNECGVNPSLAPTSAQQQIERDFCATCPDGADPSEPVACSTFFDSGGVTTGGALQGGVGYAVLQVGDALLAQIDACTMTSLTNDGGVGCAFSFVQCVYPIVTAATRPAECQ